MRSSAFIRFFRPLSGLVFWAAQFSVIYAATALACARGGEGFSGTVQFLVAASTLLALAATAWVFALACRTQHTAAPVDTFLQTMTLWGNALAMVAIVWNALPVLILRVCA